MMGLGQLVVGQAVEIAVDGAGDAPPLKAVVIGLPSREVLVTFPDLRAAPPELVVGKAAELRYWSGLGAHVASCFVDRVAAGPPVTAALERPARVETVQRRKFFRVNAGLAARVDVKRSAVEGSTGLVEERTVVRDLSAGGLRLETGILLTVDDRLLVALTTPRIARPTLPDVLESEARVVRIGERGARGERAYVVGVELMFQAENDRDRWVQLSFELQRGLKA